MPDAETNQPVQRVRAALRAAQVGIWEVDPASLRVHWSPEMYALYGLDARQLEIDLSAWMSRIHSKDRLQTRERIEHAIERQTELECSFRICLDNGEYRSMLLKGAPRPSENDQQALFVGTHWRIDGQGPSPRLEGVLKGLGATPGRYVLLAPGATWPSKEWPLGHWRRLADALVADGRTVVVLQPPGRPVVADALAPVLPGGRGGVLPTLALAEALQAVGAAAAVVSVDGGIMHAAVGMGRPTVALFGPTDPGLWFPYEGLGPFRVLATRPACHPCHRHTCDEFICLPDLTPDRVRAALDDLPAASSAPD